MKTDDLLLTASKLIEAGECEDAAKLLGNAMMTARPRAKRRIVAMLEQITEYSAAASCNLALALLRGGWRRDCGGNGLIGSFPAM